MPGGALFSLWKIDHSDSGRALAKNVNMISMFGLYLPFEVMSRFISTQLLEITS